MILFGKSQDFSGGRADDRAKKGGADRAREGEPMAQRGEPIAQGKGATAQGKGSRSRKGRGADRASALEPHNPRFMIQMPRVVAEQKHKFENDELFKKLSRDAEVRYTGYRDLTTEQRRIKFANGCREGHTEIAAVGAGVNLQLVFTPLSNGYGTLLHQGALLPDFEREPGKVHIISHIFIFNGVCVRWRGSLDLDRLEGVGCLEFDEHAAKIEECLLKRQIEHYNQRLQRFEERYRFEPS
ncbi:unnamed protein product [Cyprideis torosa]|uniref:Uncharacterized protein n=1 Tax=Cyprideis torosa TaxID=163714 RepID=A0A7R8WA16_9CRUS|nr:unnamed protein product [Cyprideis torosa]CAG0889108.1 unnamed protein product [Cyprideis torosa]